jgi:hypothetical protein
MFKSPAFKATSTKREDGKIGKRRESKFVASAVIASTS